MALTLVSAAIVGILAGCGNSNDMTKAQIDSIKNSPKMTDADRSRVAQAMAAGGAKASSEEAAWAAKQDKAKVAAINAERAKMGRPPLGQ